MSAQNFILRSTQQGVPEPPGQTVISWVPGTVQPFSSLWIVVQRFAILNRPSKPLFDRDLGTLKKVKIEGFSLPSWEPPAQDLQLAQTLRIAQLLGEPPSAFQRARLSQFPRATQQLFYPELWWCWDCLMGGFHCVLFSLKGLQKCPYHKRELTMSCSRCQRRVNHESIAAWLARPGYCTCGLRFLGAKMARWPETLPGRDACLKELDDWLTSASKRLWFQLPDKLTTYPMSFRRHLTHWEQALLISSPPASWSVPPVVQTQKLGPWSPQLHLSGRRQSSIRQQQPHASGDPEFSCVPTFKSVRRYIAHHVLIDGRHWITSLAMSSDSEKITSVVERSEESRGAWTTLLWWQACVGSLSLRDWFRSCRPSAFDERQFEKDVIARGGQDLAWLSTADFNWIRQHLYAASLMFLWDCAQRVTTRTVAGFGATWGWGATATDSLPLRPQTYHAPGWSCAKDERGRVSLLVDTPEIGWIPAPRCDRSARQTGAQEREKKRRCEIAAYCERTCIWYHPRTQDWLVHAGPTPRVPLDYRRRRLGGDEPQIFFLIFRVGEDGSKEFVGRCHSLPLAATGETPKAAIEALKWAVHHYRRYLQPMTGTPL